MQSITILREISVERTPRVMQLESMFDVPPSERSSVKWEAHLPIDEREWGVGLIVGPSGSGKTTLARELFPEHYIAPDSIKWSPTASVLDNFPSEMPIKEIIACLTSVGFSTVPNWLRPYSVLSTGEQFRANMARAIAQNEGTIVIDEFTSVVDRQVARIASHAVQKAVRRRGVRFVAVSCHYDIIDWLQPDWIYQPESDSFQWRLLQRRPSIELEVHSIGREAWSLFSKYHYLSADLHTAARCFGGFVQDPDTGMERCIAFSAHRPFPHPRRKNLIAAHRTVVHPDYQGLGIGGILEDWVGSYLAKQGLQYFVAAANPARLAYLAKSPRWELYRTGRTAKSGRTAGTMRSHQDSFSLTRFSSSFRYKAEIAHGEDE